ncbi:MAG: DUF4097 family beta strand repeat protein [Bdellovibrionales bacterium]|nr:DUF4097 family beta strand repeat protein [Bdellovibrionales bacterium]
MQKFCVALIILGMSLSSKAEVFQFDSAEVHSLHIENPFGSVNIAPSLTNKSSVALEKQEWADRCKASVELDKNKLNVLISDEKTIRDQACRVDLVIAIPEKTLVDLNLGISDVKAVGLKGDLTMKVLAGNHHIEGHLKKMKINVRQGSLNIQGPAENMDVRLDKGNVQMSVDEKMDLSVIHAMLGDGDLLVKLPGNTAVYTESSTGNGTIRNDFLQERSSHQVKIKAFALRGDIHVTKN